MMTRYYRFADVTAAVTMQENLFYEEEKRLEPFRVETGEPNSQFFFQRLEHLSAPCGELVSRQHGLQYLCGEGHYIRYIDVFKDNWAEATARVEYCGNMAHVQLRKARVPARITANYVLDCMAAEHLIARNNGFIFHCSYIDHGGKAILFTAPSETGKSTQADLWQKYRGSEIINGDRAAVRLVDGTLMAEGIPFSGSSQYCKNRSLPIEAIVYLGQAPKTSIRRMRGYEVFSKIWEGVSVNTWDRKDMETVSAVVQEAAQRVPMFHMPCTPDETAVNVLEDALRKLVNP